MKKRLLVWICSLLAVVLLLPSFPVSAQSAPPEVSSTAAILYNLETDQILLEKNTDVRLSPAAFTKLMTALLSYEYRAANGNVTVTVTEEMLSAAGGTSMRLKAGEVLTFDQLLSGLVVQNANDAALVLASVAGGSIATFVEQMNERAKELGMEHTYYANPTGVDAAVMYTSLQDTLILCKALYRVNAFMLLSETPKITIPATNLTEERVYTNKNALIPFSYVTDYYMKGARGMVAGYTQSAGYCVASVHQKGNATYLAIVSGGTDRSEAQNQTDISSYREAKALLEWGEEAFAIQEVLPKGKVLCEKKVRLGAGVDHMILVSGESFSALLPSDLKAEEITYEIHSD
ncbi:MAG: D-alanyl-D-alanine carboxypeptidase [Clostridia bacterium]|nr:D-alanyl-D-alanine carboxypeptidase [Clostridia bacterium]